ncbi:MAG: DUF1565 domain-containing protein [Acidobacteriota bacterium]
MKTYVFGGTVGALTLASTLSFGAVQSVEFSESWAPVQSSGLYRQTPPAGSPGETGQFATVVANFFWNSVNVYAAGSGEDGLDRTAPRILQKIPISGAISDVVVGDFNHDGVDDFAVADFIGSYIEAFVSRTDGSYRLASRIQVEQGPVSLAVRDYNGDGQLDIASANYFDRSISTAAGDGAGRFEHARSHAADTELPGRPLFYGDAKPVTDYGALKNAVKSAAMSTSTRRRLERWVSRSENAYDGGNIRGAVRQLQLLIRYLKTADDSRLSAASRQSLRLLALDVINSLLGTTRVSVNLSATPDTISIGGSSTLQWTSAHAVSAKIDNGIGDVPVNGSLSVSPGASIIYTISVLDADGLAAVDSARVTVTGGAGTVYVDVNRGNDTTGDGTLDKPFKTITKGLSVATGGTTVSIASGYYAESTGETFPLMVPTGVIVQGAGQNSTTVYGGGTYHSPLLALDRNVMFVAGNGSALKAIGLMGGGQFGVWIEDVAATIAGIRALAFSYNTIQVVGTGSLQLQSSTIEAALLYGVRAENHCTTTIDGCAFRWNWFGAGGTSDQTTTISNTSFLASSATDLSFSALGAGPISVTGSAFASAANSAIQNIAMQLGGLDAGSLITGNSVAGSYQVGIYLIQSPVTFRNNSVTGCTLVGAYSIESAADFGTAGSPGGNTFHNLATGQANLRNVGNQLVTAVGNAWDQWPSVDFTGTYPGGHDIEGSPTAGVLY